MIKLVMFLLLFTAVANAQTGKTQTAYFASGCFWCTEAIFELIVGVKSAESGYTGGKTVKPTYEQVCSGKTGHAEAIKVVYYPNKCSATSSIFETKTILIIAFLMAILLYLDTNMVANPSFSAS